VDPHPLIEQRVFNGVENVNAKDLGNTLSTQPTKCRAFFLKPLCSLTHNHLFETRNWLDRDQLRRDVLRIKVYYWLRGFRHTQVDTVVAEKGRGVSVTFNVREGPPTVITAVDLTQPLEKISNRRLRRMGLPQAGDRIDLTRLDSVRTKARRFLWDAGYGNAFVADSAHPLDSLHVHLAVNINSGPITTVDTVVVKGNEKVTSRTVQRLIAMRRGDIFKRPQLLEGQRRLYRSNLFRMSLIEVPDSADSAKTVVVTVREAPMKGMQLGAGYNTVEFGQLQANLTLYNFKGSARRVDLHSALGNLGASRTYCRRVLCSVAEPGTSAGDIDRSFLSPTWQLSASISQPWFFSTNNSIGMTAFSNRRVVPGIVIDRGNGVSATFTRTIKPSLPVSLSYRFERSRVDAGQLYFCVNFGYCMSSTIGDLQQWRNFSPFVLNVTADRTDDPLEPHTGYTGSIDVEHASPATGSDWAFTRYEAEFTPYFRIGKRTLVVRGHYGRVSGNELHPRTRFYAGGSRSVRGYAEGQLGPRVLTVDPNKLECTPVSIADASCDPNPTPSVDFVPRPVGGNSLLEGTIEYRATLTRAIGGAVFVDYGRVTPNKDESARLSARSAITPGIGFRYSSPIGPVRVDLGLRPKRTEDLHVLTEVRDSASNLLRLVELNRTKAYDRAEGSRGFFGKAFSRMQLHIYIGEAY
jgi:outer membrane protein insertion porin family